MLTLAEFRATARYETDLPARFDIDPDAVSETAFVYADECYIEIHPENPLGNYYLLIGRENWIGDDLAELEAELYHRWYRPEHEGKVGQAVSPISVDQSACDRCGKHFAHTELDAVFLAEDMSVASSEAYCRKCFPKMRIFQWDQWKSLEPVSLWHQARAMIAGYAHATRRLLHFNKGA